VVEGTGQPPAAGPPPSRWSPYPVQDWSALPVDPLAPVPEPPAAVRAERRRPWWLPLVALALVGTLLSVVVHAATTDEGPTDAASRYLPADGHASWQQTEAATPERRRRTTAVTESARLAGLAGVLAVDPALSVRLIDEATADPGLRLWRTVTTPVDGSGQTTAVYRTGDGVALLGENGPNGLLQFRPGLLELPADVAPGRQWSSAGTTGPGQPYRSELSAEAGDNGCLRVQGRLVLGDGSGSRQLDLERTWCPGRGLVGDAVTEGSRRSATLAQEPVPARPRTASRPLRWREPQSWTARQLDTVTVDPRAGAQPMVGSPKQLAPVRTTSGVVVRALDAQRDLVGTRPADASSWRSIWRAHPGGDVLTLAVLGDVVVVTTSQRAVVAYSDQGVPLWRVVLDELVPAAAVPLTEQSLVLVGLDGVVRTFDVADGSPGWTAALDADVTLAPAVGAGLVVVADRGGTTTALDAATGAERWSVPLIGTAVVVAEPGVVVLQDQSVHALDPANGRHRWLRPFRGSFQALVPAGDGVLVATSSGSVQLDRAGQVAARLDGFLAVTVTEDHLVGWGSAEASLLDSGGAVLARWPLPADATLFGERPAVALPDGVLLATGTWTLHGWSR
jgi:outer membrane protein assembly factor BamB